MGNVGNSYAADVLMLHLVKGFQPLPVKGEHPVHIGEIRVAVLRNDDVATYTVKKLKPDICFKFFDCVAERGGGNIQHICRLGQITHVSNGFETLQGINIHNYSPCAICVLFSEEYHHLFDISRGFGNFIRIKQKFHKKTFEKLEQLLVK